MMKRFSDVSYGSLVRQWIEKQPIGARFTTSQTAIDLGLETGYISPVFCYLEKCNDIKKVGKESKNFVYEKLRNSTIKDHSSKKREQRVIVTRRANVLSPNIFEPHNNPNVTINELREEFACQRDTIIDALCKIEEILNR